MPGKLRDTVFIFLIAGLGFLLGPYFSDSIKKRVLTDFPQTTFLIKNLNVSKVNPSPVRGNSTQVYDLIIYSIKNEQYFLRSLEEDDLLRLKFQLKIGEKITLFHLDEIEKNGGKRIIELRTQGVPIYSFEQAVYEQESKYWYARVVGVLMLSFAGLIVWYYFYFKRGKVE